MADCPTGVLSVTAPTQESLSQVTPVPVVKNETPPSTPNQSLPDIPDWLDVNDPTAWKIPTLADFPEVSYALPEIDIPPDIDSVTAPFTETLPTINEVLVDDYVDRATPTAPVLQTITIEELGDYALPTFDEAVPTDTLVTLNDAVNFIEEDFQSSLNDYIILAFDTSTIGVAAQKEEALFARGLDRNQQIINMPVSSISQIANIFSNIIPHPARQAMMAGASEHGMMIDSDHSAFKKLKREELNQDQIAWVWGKGLEYEHDGLKFYEGRMNRGLSAMKVKAELALKVFSLALEQLKSRIDAYNTISEVFATRIRAEAQKVDIFRTKLESAKVKVEVQNTYAEIYKAQLDGVKALADVYKTRMEAAKAQSQVQKIKLDAFKTSVDAYVAFVNSKATEAKVFESLVKGRTAKVHLYKAASEAYGAAVGAYRTKVQAGETVVKANVSIAGLELDEYKIKLDRYKHQMDTSKARIDAKTNLYKNDVQRFAAETTVQASIEKTNAQIKRQYASTFLKAAGIYKDYAVSTSQLSLDEAEMYMREAIACAENQSKRMIANADISSAEEINKGSISSSETIAAAEDETSLRIALANAATQRNNAIVSLNAAWASSLNQIIAAENSTVTGLMINENDEYLKAMLAIAAADARVARANANLTVTVSPYV